MPKVIVVDDDHQICEAIRAVLEDDGRAVDTYESFEAFLDAFHPDKSECLLIDAYLPGLSGLELLEKLRDEGHHLPAIMITGNADVPMAVMAMKAGALDFIEKPIGREELLASVERALDLAHIGQVDGMASERSGSPHGARAATTRRHGAGVGRAPKQEHCCRSRHQSTYGREPPRLDHEENRVEVVARVGEIGVSCLGWRRRAATGALRLWLLGRLWWRPAPSCFASVHLIDRLFLESSYGQY